MAATVSTMAAIDRIWPRLTDMAAIGDYSFFFGTSAVLSALLSSALLSSALLCFPLLCSPLVSALLCSPLLSSALLCSLPLSHTRTHSAVTGSLPSTAWRRCATSAASASATTSSPQALCACTLTALRTSPIGPHAGTLPPRLTRRRGRAALALPGGRRCAQCLEPLPDGQFFEKNGRLYCDIDYMLLFADRCARCGDGIVGRCLNALNSKWHPEHFTCDECGVTLAGSSFFKRQDRPMCKACNDRLKIVGTHRAASRHDAAANGRRRTTA